MRLIIKQIKAALCLFFVLVIFIGCEQKQTNNQLDKATQEKVMNMWNHVAKNFPGSDKPKYNGIEDSRLKQLVNITDQNHLVVDGNQAVILAGITCDKPSLAAYLQSMLDAQTKHHRLVMDYTGLKSGDKRYAYVWSVVFYGDNLSGNSSSLINEALMSSGHCVAVAQDRHGYHERYLKLQEIGTVIKDYRDRIKS